MMMQIRRLDRESLTRKYGIDAQLLLPWDALSAPFRGAWCILRQGTESTPHSHPDYEIFIAMTGSAALVVDGERRAFVPGDVAHIPPGSTHHLINDGAADFEYYAIWWDEDLSAQFVARREQELAGG
jgi:mannose-6-phosphate isomerase-like protein (cupin superfamily)